MEIIEKQVEKVKEVPLFKRLIGKWKCLGSLGSSVRHTLK